MPLVDLLQTLRTLHLPDGRIAHYYSLPALEASGIGPVSRLPMSVRIVLESVLRNCDGKLINVEQVRSLANWKASEPSDTEIPFVVSRVVLQDFTGVPLLVDLAAMRDAMYELGADPKKVEPMVPVDLVVDHSVQVDRAGSADAFAINLKMEFERNQERYEFLKWGQQAFDTFNVVPPGLGIVHQVNLEYLAQVVCEKAVEESTLLYPDTLVGTDSHTTMVNGLGVVAWGVGGIEAEVAMLGQPIYFQTPAVVGVHLHGSLAAGVTATDLTLRLTELLRKEKVVGQFVEFFGEGAARLSVADRATIANMAPEYGATMGYFPIDDKTLDYLRMSGRSRTHIEKVEAYLKAQGLFGMPKKGELLYTRSIDLDLSTIQPCVAGPKRPQDRIDLTDIKKRFRELLSLDIAQGGYACLEEELHQTVALPYQAPSKAETLAHGSVVIAAITSCTNTSNPSVMMAAGLLAKKAVEKGLVLPSFVKASLAPGSRVVSDYLEASGLQVYLDKLGFNLVGYGCTTCIGNSGPLAPEIEEAIQSGKLVAASVLSGNRNFEARVHPSVRANFLMSPPLVVAFALAGKVDIDFNTEPIAYSSKGLPVYLKDLWPSELEIKETVHKALHPELFQKKYADIYTANENWNSIPIFGGERFDWKSDSTYIQKPPFFEGITAALEPVKPLKRMRALAVLGDSVTTDHISPASFIQAQSPAGLYLREHGVDVKDFNSYGSRRGNDRVMTRGTFANVRIKNRLAQGREGGYTTHVPSGELMPIFDACERYKAEGVPLLLFAGKDYGMGSSRDWAAKGTALLGVRAVVASSFERIHRSNLIGMGVLALEFEEGMSAEHLDLRGDEFFDIICADLSPHAHAELVVTRSGGSFTKLPLKVRLDTAIEVAYFKNAGLMPYILRQLLKS